jgi:hypothetical protein
LDEDESGKFIAGSVNQLPMGMPKQLQIDSCHYKCRNCNKPHVAPTRTLDFRCIREQTLEHGLERIYEAELTSHCDCDEKITITFQAREYPPGLFDYYGYRSNNAEVILAPRVREHAAIVDL